MITDGRFSGGSRGFIVGHVSPEAYNGGMIALVRDGDIITITKESLDVNISEMELIARKVNGYDIKENCDSEYLKQFRKNICESYQGY